MYNLCRLLRSFIIIPIFLMRSQGFSQMLQLLHVHTIPPFFIKPLLDVLYHVIDAIPSYHGSVAPALNELGLGLKPEEVALSGVYAKDVHARMACVNAAKCIPAISSRSVPEEHCYQHLDCAT
ncbi:hypothetical protein Tco_1527634 [Tanacetum coccineum]